MSKILLVEDDNNLREIYEARLQAEGYTIISARDGEEALVFAKNEKPDLVISDVMMPKISGFEMLDILRNTEGLKQVKVIMLTALGQSDDQQRANRLGADHYLVKSQVTLEDIVKVAHELLQDEPSPQPAPPVAPAPVATPVPQPVAPAPPQPTPPIAPTQSVVPQPAPAISVSSPATAAPAVTAPSPQPAPPVAPAPVATPVPQPVETNGTLPEANPENESNPSISVASIFANASDMNLDAKPTENTPEPIKSDPEHIENETKAEGESVAQSTAEEEASVEAKIEDFVTGASSNPDKPVVDAPKGADEATTSSESENTDKPSDNAEDIKNDDKLMQNAVNTLITESEPKPSSPPVTITAAASSTFETAPPPENTSTSIDTVPQPTSNQQHENVTIAHKKIITPVGAEPKQDLDTLLALETAKESGPAQPPQVIVSEDTQTEPEANHQSGSVIAPPPSVPPPLVNPTPTPTPPSANANTDPSNGEERVDPNSIAL